MHAHAFRFLRLGREHIFLFFLFYFLRLLCVCILNSNQRKTDEHYRLLHPKERRPGIFESRMISSLQSNVSTRLVLRESNSLKRRKLTLVEGLFSRRRTVVTLSALLLLSCRLPKRLIGATFVVEHGSKWPIAKIISFTIHLAGRRESHLMSKTF